MAATSGSRFNLWSLSGVGPDVNGSAVNFNSAQNGSWKIASAAGGITGFAADKFAIETAATNGTADFTNDLAGGSFAVVQDGNDLVPPPVSPARGPPTDWGGLAQVHDDRDIFQERIDELPAIDVHSL